MTINDWISGAYAFQVFGKGYKIAELVGEATPAGKAVISFSDAVSLNHLPSVDSCARKLKPALSDDIDDLARQILPKLFADYGAKLSRSERDTVAKYQYKVARWNFEHHNYSSAYLSIIESVVSWVCEVSNRDSGDKESRDWAKSILKGELEPLFSLKHDGRFPVVVSVFQNANKVRNSIAHMLDRKYALQQMIQTLKSSLEDLSDVF